MKLQEIIDEITDILGKEICNENEVIEQVSYEMQIDELLVTHVVKQCLVKGWFKQHWTVEEGFAIENRFPNWFCSHSAGRKVRSK